MRKRVSVLKALLIVFLSTLVLWGIYFSFQIGKPTPTPPLKVIKITHCEEGKLVQVDSLIVGVVPVEISDSEILEFIKQDSLVNEQLDKQQFVRDSLRIDSLQKVHFKKVTRIVNGGYIGWEGRLREWVRIKRILTDTIK